MAKKFLDFTGLQKYDELLKAKVAKDIKAVQDDVNTRKVKDTANSGTITWSKAENGTYTASVTGDVVVDAEYQTVKTKATNSAAAWTKFLDGSNVAYPDGITPGLKDLATTASVNKAISDGDSSTLAAAKSYVDGKVDGKFDTVGSAAQALVDAKSYADGLVKDAQGNAKFDAKGSATTAKNEAIKAAKDYADGLAVNYDAKGSAATAEQNAKDYADGLASNYDAAGSAAQALKDAKTYADTNFDPKGSAENAKNAAISDAKTYTNGEIKKVDDQIKAINTSIAGGVHFIGISTTEITDKGTQTPTIEGWNGTVNKGDIVINNNSEEFIWDGTKWQKLGDTTKESQRITALEGHVNTLRGDNTVEGSVAKALKDANTYTDGKITALVTTGKVKENADAIATLNGNSSTVGSVDYKIAQVVSNIEASIDTITETDINTLFGK